MSMELVEVGDAARRLDELIDRVCAGDEIYIMREGVPIAALQPARASKRVRYAIIIEHGPTSCSAYVPDLPGCVAVAENEAEVMTLIREAIEFHLECLREDGEPIPAPVSQVEYVDVTPVAA